MFTRYNRKYLRNEIPFFRPLGLLTKLVKDLNLLFYVYFLGFSFTIDKKEISWTTYATTSCFSPEDNGVSIGGLVGSMARNAYY